MMRSGVRLSSAPLSLSLADRGRYREPSPVGTCGSEAPESGSRTGFPLGVSQMARLSKNALPSLRLHRASGQGVVTLNGREFYLGPRAEPACEERYNALLARWISNGRRPIEGTREARADDNGITVVELIAKYVEFAEDRYSRRRATIHNIRWGPFGPPHPLRPRACGRLWAQSPANRPALSRRTLATALRERSEQAGVTSCTHRQAPRRRPRLLRAAR